MGLLLLDSQDSGDVTGAAAADITEDWTAAAEAQSFPGFVAVVAADMTDDWTAEATCRGGMGFVPPEPNSLRIARVTHAY